MPVTGGADVAFAREYLLGVTLSQHPLIAKPCMEFIATSAGGAQHVQICRVFVQMCRCLPLVNFQILVFVKFNYSPLIVVRCYMFVTLGCLPPLMFRRSPCIKCTDSLFRISKCSPIILFSYSSFIILNTPHYTTFLHSFHLWHL